jgi:hypothetical protein
MPLSTVLGGMRALLIFNTVVMEEWWQLSLIGYSRKVHFSLGDSDLHGPLVERISAFMDTLSPPT